MAITTSITNYLAATSKGTYTVVDKRGKRTIITTNSDTIKLVHNARQKPKRLKLIHKILYKFTNKLHKFLDSDFFY